MSQYFILSLLHLTSEWICSFLISTTKFLSLSFSWCAGKNCQCQKMIPQVHHFQLMVLINPNSYQCSVNLLIHLVPWKIIFVPNWGCSQHRASGCPGSWFILMLISCFICLFNWKCQRFTKCFWKHCCLGDTVQTAKAKMIPCLLTHIKK